MSQTQKSTHQVPWGPHSLLYEGRSLQAPSFAIMVYLFINYFSKWETGHSHGLSLKRIATGLGIYRQNAKGQWTGKSRVSNAIAWLVKHGWLEKNIRGNGKPNTYVITRHNCAPDEVPIDKDGRPQHCAMPYAEGSPVQKMIEGKISWEACLYHFIAKAVSDWKEGLVRITIREAQKWLRFSRQKIVDIRKSLLENGLLEEIGNRFRGFTARILPKPYEKRVSRMEQDAAKGMRSDSRYFYSYNELWRICRLTGDFQTVKTSGGWRFAGERELEETNRSIYRDFMNMHHTIQRLNKKAPGRLKALKDAGAIP